METRFSNDTDFFKSFEMGENGLLKARQHKYYRREGGPGKYKYYYTEEQYRKEKGMEKKKEGEKGLDKKIENLYDKYKAKDYFMDKGTLESYERNKEAVAEAIGRKNAGKPGVEKAVADIKKGGESLKNFFNEAWKEGRMDWLKDSANKIKNKDMEWMKKTIRYDQKLMKELFKEVTGIDVSNKSNVQLKEVFEKYAKGEGGKAITGKSFEEIINKIKKDYINADKLFIKTPEGKDAFISPKKYGKQWWDKATSSDLKRIMVY